MLFYVLIVVCMPFLYWVWLGIAFTIIDYALHMGLREGLYIMTEAYKTANRPSRLIRYADLNVQGKPGLLSVYDEQKNLVIIDRTRSATMPDPDRHRLEMTDLPFTRLSDSLKTLAFVEYDA